MLYVNPRVRLHLTCVVARSSVTRRSWSSSRDEASTSSSGYHPLDILEGVDIVKFRKRCFIPELPITLPPGYFGDFPAVERWFQTSLSQPEASRLNIAYLKQHGADALVPLELTQSHLEQSAHQESPGKDEIGFRKFHAPLSLFLEWIRAAETQSPPTRLYLAQCQLLDLPQTLRNDFPTPALVSQAGRGDIYDTNVWIGHPPTYTPLHRDPNPNLFVQLAGKKVVRLIAPDKGQALFASVRQKLEKSGGHEAAAFRGEEMMQGQERALLEEAVWGDVSDISGSKNDCKGYEVHLEAGDGLFIPKAWWHSIKGVGKRVTASVNWWFR